MKNSEKQLSIENKRYAVLHLWYADKTSGMQMWYFGLQQLNLFCMWFAGWKGEVRRLYWFAGGLRTIFLAQRWFADSLLIGII